MQQWSFRNFYVCYVLIANHLQLTAEEALTVNCRRFFKISAVNYSRFWKSSTIVEGYFHILHVCFTLTTNFQGHYCKSKTIVSFIY